VGTRLVRRLAAAALVPTVLVVGHELDFLLAYGAQYRVALIRTGHDGRWDSAVLTVLLAAAVLTIVGLGRLAWLARRLRAAGASSTVGLGPGIGASVAKLWLRLFVLALLLFVLQENYERASAGIDTPGLGVLLPDRGSNPPLVFAAVAAVVAAVWSLFRRTMEVLEERLARVTSGFRPAPAVVRRPPRLADRPASSLLGRNLAGRAPPLVLPA